MVEGKLSLTIPWIVKYLAMMDVVSLRLPYYKQILELLYYVHSAISHTDLSAADCPISQQAAVLLKSSLCWLFELSNFPKDLHAVWQKTCKVKELRSLRSHLNQTDRALPAKCALDKLDIIIDRTMRMCCPRTESALPVFNGRFECRTSAGSNKHITPVTSRLRKSAGPTQAKHLEVCFIVIIACSVSVSLLDCYSIISVHWRYVHYIKKLFRYI